MLNLKIYNITPDYEKLEYSFLSVGPRGSILNVARFSVSRVKNIYQFEYGVINKDTGEIDDKIVTNNQDTVLVINTICFILHDFLTHFEGTMVRFAGSTRARTRLFIMWIWNNWKEVDENFILFGRLENGIWERFKPNRRYEAVLLKPNL